MRTAVILVAAAMGSCLSLVSCQPKIDEEPPPRQPAVLDYTLLGIWPERFHAYQVTEALGEAGIRSKLSGHQPSLLNVETSKLSQAQAIVIANPEWQQARIR